MKTSYLRTFVRLMAFAMISFGLFTSCKKEDESEDMRIPPAVSFKTGSGYTSTDATVGVNDTLKVGIIADKTEDELKTFNISYKVDSVATTSTFQTFMLSGAEEEHYEKDVQVIMRNQPGNETWVFTITDRDGNITSKSLHFLVQ